MITKIITTVKTQDLVDLIWRERNEYYGLSTDIKPIEGVQNADIFYEMDTRKAFMFDEEGSTWIEQ
jgi:hypothetical protein